MGDALDPGAIGELSEGFDGDVIRPDDRAYDEARGIEWPVIWTAERDRELWTALQG